MDFVAIQTANIVCPSISRLHHYEGWFLTFPSVTENGFAVKGEDDISIQEALKDDERIHYFEGTTDALVKAIHEDSIDIRSYFPWSMFFLVSHWGSSWRVILGLLDNFEWANGYTTRFGVTYVDFETQKRYPKDSAKYLVKVFYFILLS